MVKYGMSSNLPYLAKEDAGAVNEDLSRVEPGIQGQSLESLEPEKSPLWTLKRLRGGALFAIGYLLSPLCWWNDLVFNLPVAYGVGYLCRWLSPNLFLPGLIAGYWLSNLVGILLMQFGAIDVVQKEASGRNLRRDLLTGVVTSTAYTLIILGLVQLKVIDVAALFGGDSFISGLWPL